MGEKSYEAALVRCVKKAGGACLKMHVFDFAGLPDRIILLPHGRVYFAEIKSPGEKPGRLQRFWLRKLEKMGFTVFVVDSPHMLQGLKNIINR